MLVDMLNASEDQLERDEEREVFGPHTIVHGCRLFPHDEFFQNYNYDRELEFVRGLTPARYDMLLDFLVALGEDGGVDEQGQRDNMDRFLRAALYLGAESKAKTAGGSAYDGDPDEKEEEDEKKEPEPWDESTRKWHMRLFYTIYDPLIERLEFCRDEDLDARDCD
ncbi:hypothetical protein TWF696_006071 [Orbilia brochopaga]|uniref:Uncharacterized protein n=1 Tax=Orbilia brochopaga TaxID=3140254 RepID=A0AAV9UV76_9PEZI